MLRPVGQLPSGVYWRRRLAVLVSLAILLVLLAVTVRAITSGDGDASATNATGPSKTPLTSSSHAATPSSGHASTTPPRTAGRTSSAKTSKASRTGSPSKSGTSTTTHSAPPPARCVMSKLAVSAVVGSADYRVGDKPIVAVQVTNTGTTPCVQDLADRQIELKIYNGESRVWGSHDCKIIPGTSDRTLAAAGSVRVQVTWSGYTSEPRCAGTRQKVGAGSYTLYASLGGKTGKAAPFSIS